MKEHKSLQVIDKNNLEEIKIELFNRKRDLVSFKIHGTLKQDPVIIKKAKELKEECRQLQTFITVIEKAVKLKKSVEIEKTTTNQINKKVK